MGFVPTNKVTYQAIKSVDVTPDDNNDLAIIGAIIFVGTGGNLEVTTVSGDTVIYKNLPDAYTLPVQVRRVKATNTTATDIIAQY
jgi:hypothetical protein|tara:strand:+ start:350 stop:604 length:255 start_codon:yes stop_codon:yes gene_type:complete